MRGSNDNYCLGEYLGSKNKTKPKETYLNPTRDFLAFSIRAGALGNDEAVARRGDLERLGRGEMDRPNRSRL